MTTIFGTDIVKEKMLRETMTPQTHVAIDHNFYSEFPNDHKEKKKNHPKKHEKHAKGDSIGKNKREEFAIGGAAKTRRHYPMT